jgi:transposase
LLCNKEGCPISVEVFEGNTSDPTTFTQQIEKVRARFEIQQVIWVGGRGIISSTRIKSSFKKEHQVDWISALRSSQIRSLIELDCIQLSLFEEKNIAEISSPDYPGERLIACRNPILAADRAKTREELLQATEKELSKIAASTTRHKLPLRGESHIALKVGQVLNRYSVGKHFKIDIKADSFSFERDIQKIESEAALDGLYIIRTSVNPESKSLKPLLGIPYEFCQRGKFSLKFQRKESKRSQISFQINHIFLLVLNSLTILLHYMSQFMGK